MKEYLIWIRWEEEPTDIDSCERAWNEEYMWVDASTPEEALEKAKESWEYPYDLMSVVDDTSEEWAWIKNTTEENCPDFQSEKA